MSELLKDPFLYFNYGIIITGTLLIRQYSKKLDDAFKRKASGREILGIALLMLVIFLTALYISYEAGNVSLKKLGIDP